MKVKLLAISLILLMALSVLAAPPVSRNSTKGTPPAVKSIDNEPYIDANNILMFVTNTGSFGRDLAGVFGYDYGTFFPYNGVQYILDGSQVRSPLYASGLWVGGRDSASGETRVKVAEYNSEYRQGPYRQTVDDSINYYPDAPEFKVYKIYSDSLASNPNADYNNWEIVARQGAPFQVVGNDSVPVLIGDQMCWAVYNDADTANKNDAGSTNSLGLEIRQTTFAFRREGPLNNIVFVKFQVFNKGRRTIQDCYFSLWADPDLGGSSDDLVGCDTTLSVGFTYNANNADNQYGSRPPCTAYDFLQGPLYYTGDPNDVGKAWGTTWPGYQNLGMVSFNKYINGTDPVNFVETYNYMQGLNADGTPLANGTKYNFPGDPVTGTGDLDFDPADRRMMQSTGPITFRPGDSTEILAAIIIGQGGDRKSSISVAKFFDVTAQSAYDLDFDIPKAPVAPRVTIKNLDGTVSLRWTDTSEVDPGDYPFQGYTVYQGESPAGPWTQIGNFDLVDGESNILDNVLDPNTGILEFRAVKVATDNGIQRYFGAQEDYINGGELLNTTQYFYKVEAYSYNPAESPKTLTSATILTAIPQPPIAEVDYRTEYGQTLAVIHATGPSDGIISPIVIDPSILTGNDYQVSFGTYPETTATYTPFAVDTIEFFYTFVTTPNICFITYDFDTIYCVDTTLDSVYADTILESYDTAIVDISYWRLRNTTTGQLILDRQLNQTGDEDYSIFDGMIVKVSGPEPGLKPGFAGDANQGWSIPSGTRRFTWAGGADGLHFEAFQGSIGWASPNTVFGGGDPAVPAPFIKNVVLRLATTDASGVFDPNDPNVSYAYRYGRGFAGPPARPEFAPYIVNAAGGYSYQDFTKSIPLSAWDVEANPPRRLALGYLENNVSGGSVDGKYWPPFYAAADNVSGDGPREWLFIFNTDYSETPDPANQVEAINNPLPIMYFSTWARRAEVGWATGDEFALYANHVNSPLDTFNFTALAPVTQSGEDRLAKINTVPNPFYLFGPYDPAVTNRQIKFQHLPDLCTIYIYTLAGDLVRTIQKTDATTSIESWDVLTENGLPVASGIYIYVVDAPGMGQKIGKMAVFTEAEVIQKY
ncbi:MAG: hypothetical protein AB1644_11695 [Candidatus Zixiibacteriota bacterium]